MTPSSPLLANVMVVDDTPANLLLLEEILTEGGYDVSAFPSGELALAAARAGPPDLLLLDIMMPGLDGYAVCEQFRADAVLSDVPILFISALNSLTDKTRAFRAGGVDYLTKPFYPEEVLSRVRTHLELREQRQRGERQKEEVARAYADLRALEQQRDDLVHMVAHDMKSPLAAIIMGGSMLKDLLPQLAEADRKLWQAGDRVLETMIKSAQRLRDMVANLVDVSRLENDAMPVNLECHKVRDLVDRGLESLGPQLLPLGFTQIVPPRTVEVCCDAGLVGRILQNFLNNALVHAGAEACITLEVEERPEVVCFSVRDNGKGIPAAARARIFEKFGQAGEGTDSRQHGSGLGLTFCKLAVEAQGGTIGVNSEPGQGSTFWFTLPTAA